MRIKKHPTGNEYIKVDNIWVRNFTKNYLTPLQITHLFDRKDYHIILENEKLNTNFPKISNEKIIFRKIVIVSDGYQFSEKQNLLNDLPKDVGIFAVNGSLKKWNLKKSINGYIINNPYSEALKYLPQKNYYPVCIASTRTNHVFTKKYPGDVYTYLPTTELLFGSQDKEQYSIDDYRNSICAAIGLSFHFGVEKLLLFCCDDSFENKQNDSILLNNSLYTHPEQLLVNKLINANLYWLKIFKDRKIEIANYSCGENIENTKTIDNVLDFFKK